MKSLLVDALRQARSGEQGQSLSDSGSFDVTSQEVLETANDSIVEESALELYETSMSVDVDGEFPESLDIDAQLEDSSRYSATALSRAAINSSGMSPDSSKGPAFARFAPVICVAFAACACVAWFAIHYFNLTSFDAELASGRIDRAALSIADESDPLASNETGRFQFIEYPTNTEVDE